MTTPENQPNQGPQSSGDLGSELRELGQQIEQAIRGALASDRARQLQADVASGLKEIGAQVQHAVKAIQEDPRVQELADKGQQTVAKARESKAAQDLQDSLARGIAQLNDQLTGFVTRLRAESDGSAPDATTPPPTTGETTRLDPDKE